MKFIELTFNEPNFWWILLRFYSKLSFPCFRSEIDLSEAELPEKDLKILELLVKRWNTHVHFKLLWLISTFRRQKSFQDEEESFQKQKQWLREKEVEEAHKVAFEKEHRELIAKKRDKEREDFYRRLEEAQQKLIIAQNNLEKVLQKHQQEKKVTFKESSPSKVLSVLCWLSWLINK